MSNRAYRAGMLSGVAFPILLAVGTLLLLSPTPDTSKGTGARVAQAWLKTINDKGDRTEIVIGSFVMLVSALALIWFAAALRDRFAGAGNPLFGFALLAAVGIIGAMVGPLAIAGGHSFGGEPLPTDGTTVWLITDLTYPFLLVIFGIASTALTVTLLITAKGSLPTWLAVFGWIAAVAGLLGVILLPMVIVLLWYLALGIHGLARPPAESAATSA